MESDTAPDGDVPWNTENGNAKRRLAKRTFGQAVLLTTLSAVEAEAKARESLAFAESALYWLEDTPFEDAAHEELHRYGRYVRENFSNGCELHWTGSRYERTCPVDKAHKRIGFSIGFVGNRLCSICGQDASECEHMPGNYYEAPGGARATGCCAVCLRSDCTEHSPEVSYQVRAAVQITEAEVFEVSLVAKPKQPDARLASIPVDSDRLREALGPEFKVGMRVSCDKCLRPCEGFDTLDGSGEHGDTVGLV